jgi:hypothetical protein
MASKKKTFTRRESDKRREAKTVLELSRRAEAEVAKLLKRNQAGTLTKVELDTGLEEVEERLKRMLSLILRIL